MVSGNFCGAATEQASKGARKHLNRSWQSDCPLLLAKKSADWSNFLATGGPGLMERGAQDGWGTLLVLGEANHRAREKQLKGEKRVGQGQDWTQERAQLESRWRVAGCVKGAQQQSAMA